MKYAGLFDEQPMPLSLITRSGCTPISYMASMMRSEIALCPQPAHSVVLPPLDNRSPSGRYGWSSGRAWRGRCGRHLLALHGHEFVGDGARIERQPVNVRNAAQPRDQFRLISSFNRLSICASRFCSTTYTRSCCSMKSCTSRVNGYAFSRR